MSSDQSRLSTSRAGSAFLVNLHILVCCLSLIYVMRFYGYLLQTGDINENRLYAAVLNVAAFAIVSVIFTVTRFSFGYILGFYFYTIVLGFLWLVEFSEHQYDHKLATISAFLSGLFFLLPALLITSPFKRRFELSPSNYDRLLSSILLLSLATIIAGAFFNFRLVGLSRIYEFRDDLNFPGWFRYLASIVLSSLLPFAFAAFLLRRAVLRAALSLLLMLLLYPITLSKLALLAPFWLILVAALSAHVSARTVVVLSLLIPISAGIVLAVLLDHDMLTYGHFIAYFGTVNYRMVAVPSSALDFYNDFFFTHQLTYFCQIGPLKALVDCPYQKPLAILMAEYYRIGNMNASMLATEGVASVGTTLAPLAALLCGMLVSLANRASAHLPANFVLLSSGLLPQVFMNVPLSTALVTNGAALLFLLWYITPRECMAADAVRGKASLTG
jgi:hypothetical protein